jgi:hypothetical protein
MADDILTQLDQHLGRPREPRPVARADSVPEEQAAPLAPAHRRPGIRERWPWLESFLVIQFLWGAALFLPNAQLIRPVVRALPYVSSIALLALYLPQKTERKHPASTSLLILALVVLAANLLHPTSQFGAGVAQAGFQLTIAAPLFWAWKAVGDEARLVKLLKIILLLNVLSAGLGVLQVYFPDRFLPPQFSTLGMQLSDTWVEELTYEGADGRVIVRPPGLTDQPGGAAIAGATAAVLGLGLCLLPAVRGFRALALAGTGIGLGVLYLTQVRSLLLMCIIGFVVMALLMFRRGRFAAGGALLVGGGVLVVASFLWAASVGGEQVLDRYVNIAEKGAVQTYRENRGQFLSYTLGELLDEFPLGAGIGRWGMMFVYFGDPTDLSAPPIHAEIQLTGWLLDGGVPLWLCYGGAVLVALLGALRCALQRRSVLAADLGTIALAAMVFIVGMGFAGPIFNTQTGLLFWFLAGALHGGTYGTRRNPSRTRLAAAEEAA